MADRVRLDVVQTLQSRPLFGKSPNLEVTSPAVTYALSDGDEGVNFQDRVVFEGNPYVSETEQLGALQTIVEGECCRRPVCVIVLSAQNASTTPLRHSRTAETSCHSIPRAEGTKHMAFLYTYRCISKCLPMVQQVSSTRATLLHARLIPSS